MFDELIGVNGVLGGVLFNEHGMVIHRELAKDIREDPSSADWWRPFVNILNGIEEFEGVFTAGRIYIRRVPDGYLMIWMDNTAPLAMIRLNSDIMLHGIKGAAPKRGFRGFFRKRV